MTGTLRVPRLALLALSAVFAIVAAAIGLNAMVEKNKNIKSVKKLAPAGVSLEVDVSDTTTTGTIATVASLLNAVLSALFLILSVLPVTKNTIGAKFRLQAGALLVPVLLAIGAMIPYMIYFTSRGPKITAFLAGKQLPAAIVAATVAKSGRSTEYVDFDYLRLLAIFPWISIAFTLAAIAVLFISKPTTAATSTSTSTSTASESDKASITQHETKAEV